MSSLLLQNNILFLIVFITYSLIYQFSVSYITKFLTVTQVEIEENLQQITSDFNILPYCVNSNILIHLLATLIFQLYLSRLPPFTNHMHRYKLSVFYSSKTSSLTRLYKTRIQKTVLLFFMHTSLKIQNFPLCLTVCKRTR